MLSRKQYCFSALLKQRFTKTHVLLSLAYIHHVKEPQMAKLEPFATPL